MNEASGWYAELVKPFFAPPSWVFGPVWTVLYIIIAVTFGIVFYRVFKGEWPILVAIPFVLNLIFNFAFSPIQFTLRSNFLASIDILLVLVTIIWMFRVIWPLAPWIIYANIPYLLWVSFATVLQLSITYLNWK